MLAVGEGTFWGLYWGLGLIALGSGGIKPSVSAFVGDQFRPGQSHLLRKVYGWFYWSINFGSFFSFLIIPWVVSRDPATTIVHGYPWAFGIPGIFMGLATLIFWLGTPNYDRVPPAGDPPSHFFKAGGVTLLAVAVLFGLGWGCGQLNLAGWITVLAYVVVALAAIIPATFMLHRRVEANRTPQAAGAFTVAWYLMTKRLTGGSGAGFYEAGRPYLTAETLDDTKALLRVLKVLSLIPFFWALWDQTSSTWVTQGTLMEPWIISMWGEKFIIGAEQMQSMNALLVMILVPVFTLGIYPKLDQMGWKATPLRRMMVGLFITAFSFVIVGIMQQRMDVLATHGQKLSVLWQTFPYIVLTAGEVLVSATGNEFAYTHAPKTMKSTMTSIWLLTISVGNLLVALFTWLARKFSSPTEVASESHAASAGQFFRYALLTFAVSVVFVFVVSRFRGTNYSEADVESPTS
jgi:POT family proton-dependent oligopeptide transporter